MAGWLAGRMGCMAKKQLVGWTVSRIDQQQQLNQRQMKEGNGETGRIQSQVKGREGNEWTDIEHIEIN